MRFALLNNERIEATRGVKGFCSYCGYVLIAKWSEMK